MSLRKKIFITGVGGQGSITTTLIIGEAATAAGLKVISSEIHGMAQRGGIVETTVLVGDVSSPIIADGEADVILGFEPVETLRSVAKASKERTLVLMNDRPLVPFTVSIGRETYPSVEDVKDRLRSAAAKLYAIDALELATRAGSAKALGAVMVGALAALEVIPIAREIWIAALLAKAPARFRDVNVAAFDAGLRATQIQMR